MAPITSLAAQMGAKVIPLTLFTLVQHFLLRERQTKDSKAREELLYDEAFTIVKSFMEEATRHTVEDLQAFSNTRIPPPPWVRTVRVLVPLTSCDKAADHLITALGGKEIAYKVVGGTRWWQVRGLDGVPGEWIAVRKDIDARRRRNKAENPLSEREKAHQAAHKGGDERADKHPEPHEYPKEMEGTPCMLYIHGGGGYFGSIDQERYTMYRYARKMSGRVFAVNYRLAPQYPFPCALHDALSAYLYLIDPPEGALHAPVDPKLIIPAGDSAGGNLVLALLQVIRDVGLPQPAGAVLISPWCDMTHSFPSCLTNAASDIIPPYGLSLHKPSLLWPPPNTLDTTVIRERFIGRLRKAVNRGLHPTEDDSDTETAITYAGKKDGQAHETTLLGDKIANAPSSTTKSASGPSKPSTQNAEAGPSHPQTHAVPGDIFTIAVDGREVTIRSQIQFYATNSQLLHPLVSPALGYLGGLPPCLFIASDKEVLRDEIIYCAHKAAHPERYPVKEATRKLYPALNGIEERFGPTDVHLQAYDETCHVLPLYSFTTPAKYCYRAIAQFCKFVISQQETGTSSNGGLNSVVTPTQGYFGANISGRPSSGLGLGALVNRRKTVTPAAPPTKDRKGSILRRLSLPTIVRRNSGTALAPLTPPIPTPGSNTTISEVDSPVEEDADSRNQPPPSPLPHGHDGVNTAGNPAVYACDEGQTPFIDHMIRERVSTNGVIRPLEDESKIDGCIMPADEIGVLNENSVRRYIQGQAIWEKKFSGVARSIETRRQKNLKIARKEGTQRLDKLRSQLHILGPSTSTAEGSSPLVRNQSADEDGMVDLSCVYSKTVLGSRQWTWGWALDGENPPPSSIVSRGDTKEARRLARFADRQLGPGGEEHSLSGNNLWSVVVEALTQGKQATARKNSMKEPPEDQAGGSEAGTSPTRGRTSRFSFRSWFHHRSPSRLPRRGSSVSST